jgi:hypothetical protein
MTRALRRYAGVGRSELRVLFNSCGLRLLISLALQESAANRDASKKSQEAAKLSTRQMKLDPAVLIRQLEIAVDMDLLQQPAAPLVREGAGREGKGFHRESKLGKAREMAQADADLLPFPFSASYVQLTKRLLGRHWQECLSNQMPSVSKGVTLLSIDDWKQRAGVAEQPQA